MSTTNYMDPFAVWKSMYSEMEPTLAKSIEKWLESDEYAAISGQMLSVSLQMEHLMRKNAEQLLKTYNVPTNKDFARIMDLIIGLEAKVDGIEERLIQLEKSTVNTPDIREQLSQITEQLETISKSLPGSTANTANNRKRTQKSEDLVEDKNLEE